MNMTTLEKLFVQIFERKDWIIEQIQRQADAYTDELASKLLTDGITPPPCLLNPRFNSHPSDPHELKKEEIISKLLLRPPRDSVAYSSDVRSLYYRPVVAGGNGQIPNEMSMETHAPNEGFNVTNEPPVTLANRNADIVCTLTHVYEQDDSVNLPQNETDARIHAPNNDLNVTNEPLVTLANPDADIVCTLNRVFHEQDDSVYSPQNETDARISSIYAAQDASLARIQRSKSRQKARELRTSAKTAAKSCLGEEHRTRISFNGDSISKSDINQSTKDKCPSEPGKCNDTAEGSGRLASSSISDDKHSLLNDDSKTNDEEELDGGILAQLTGTQSGVMEGVKFPDISLGSYGAKKSLTGKKHDIQMQNTHYSGRITRSRGSTQQTSGVNKSLEQGTSVSCNPREGKCALTYSVCDLMNEPNASNKLLAAVKTSQVGSDRNEETQVICSSKSVKEPVIVSNIAVSRVTRSRSDSMKECPLGATNHKEDGEIVVGNGPTVAVQPVNSGMKLDLVKPKQLNFDEMDRCDSNKISSPLSKKRKVDGLLGQELNPLNDSASLKDQKSSGPLFDQQSPMENVVSSQSKAARTHSHSHEDLHVETLNKKPVMEDVLLSKKRKMDGLLGQELNPLMDSASSKDHKHKISGTLFEQQSPMENVMLSQSKSATHSHEDLHECANLEDVLLSKKRKMDGLLGEKSSSSMNSASLEDYKSNDAFFEQQVPIENVVLSQSKAIRTHSVDDFDETMNTDLDMNENNVVEDVEHNSEVSLHDDDDDAVLCEGDYLDEESPGDDCIPVSKDPKPSFTSCLSKQGDQESIRTSDQDLGSSKSKELEVGTDSKLPNLKLNSAKVNTWPRGPHRNTEDQRNCFSGSRGFRCNLEAAENDLHISQSADIQSSNKRVHYEKMFDLPDGTESLHELQIAEAIVMEADDVTLSQSGPNILKLNKIEGDDVAAADQTSCDDVAVTEAGSDATMPVYEGFTIDEKIENTEIGIDFDTVENPSTLIERASIVEQICKSESTITPFSQFSSTFKQHQVKDLYKFMPEGILEDMDLDLGNSVSLDEDFRENISESDCDDISITEAGYSFPKQQTFDSLSYSGTPFSWQSKKSYSSPVGKFWDRSASSSGSSENRSSSNHDLTCFPIEEDPNSNEESENDELQENKPANQLNIPMEFAKTENNDDDDDDDMAEAEAVVVEIEEGNILELENHEPPSGPMKYRDRCGSNSVNTKVNVPPRTLDKVKYKSKFHSEGNRTPSIFTRGSMKRNESIQTQNSVRKNASVQTQNSKYQSRIQRPAQKESKRNNIVSNISSFVTILQQKQAAAVCPAKRDIKVKALEAAEAAKRREEEKENERKMKKEAMKIKRARVEKENAELNKKKKEEEQKKKEADVAARKKQREEDERKQNAKRRKIGEVRKEQKVQNEKPRGGKHVVVGNKKGPDNANENLKENKIANVVQQVPEIADKEKEKETKAIEKTPERIGSMKLTSQETSYDISPYQCSDDEDEDEDDQPNKKFIPSWASKLAVGMAVALQKEVDPETIFPIDFCCSMDEVLLPRRLQAR